MLATLMDAFWTFGAIASAAVLVYGAYLVLLLQRDPSLSEARDVAHVYTIRLVRGY